MVIEMVQAYEHIVHSVKVAEIWEKVSFLLHSLHFPSKGGGE